MESLKAVVKAVHLTMNSKILWNLWNKQRKQASSARVCAFSKTVVYKVNIKNSMLFLYTTNKFNEKGARLLHWKLYNRGKFLKIEINLEIYHAYGLENNIFRISILLNWPNHNFTSLIEINKLNLKCKEKTEIAKK